MFCRDAAPPPNEEGIPDGTYTGSCFGCKLQAGNEGTLECAQCTKPCGAKVESTIEISSCAGKDISNDAGSLACAEMKVAEEGLPVGSYTESCTGCHVEDETHGSFLTCTHCSTSDGTTAESKIAVSSCEQGNISNEGGVLTCIEPEAAADAADATTQPDASSPGDATPPAMEDEEAHTKDEL